MADSEPTTTGAPLNPVECRLDSHDFSDRMFDITVHFHVLKLQDSFYLWIGDKSNMGNLAVAMQTKFDKETRGTNVMGDVLDSTACTLAKKLAKKTGQQVFVSYNLSTSDLMILPLVEERVFEEMKTRPQKFGLDLAK